MATAPLIGSLTTAYTTAATGISPSFAPAVAPSGTPAVVSNPISFNVTLDTLTGSFVGTAVIQKSTDGGVHWGAVIFPAATSANSNAFSGTSFGLSVGLTETQSGTLYRVFVSAYTSGTLYYQFGQ
jgi:hypothetical protein